MCTYAYIVLLYYRWTTWTTGAALCSSPSANTSYQLVIMALVIAILATVRVSMEAPARSTSAAVDILIIQPSKMPMCKELRCNPSHPILMLFTPPHPQMSLEIENIKII